MKGTKSFLIVMCFLFTYFQIPKGLAQETQENIPQLVKKVRSAIVTIYAYDKKNKLVASGTGFFINFKGQIITNYHVIKDVHTVKVLTEREEMFQVKSILENKEKDLALLSINALEQDIEYLPIANSTPEPGERILVIGSPKGLEQTVSDGIVSAIRQHPIQGRVIQITAPISPGSSGSPLINFKGEVVGVATFTLVSGQNLNFAVSITEWSKTLAMINSRKDSDSLDEVKNSIFEYKASIEKLLSFYEIDLSSLEKKLKSRKELYELQMLDKKEVENLEKDLNIVKIKLLGLKKELSETNNLLKEIENFSNETNGFVEKILHSPAKESIK